MRPFKRVLCPTWSASHLRKLAVSVSRRGCGSRMRSDLHTSVGQGRTTELQNAGVTLYPRLSSTKSAISCQKFNETFDKLELRAKETSESVTLHGRISSIRKAGSRLAFIDIIQNGHRVQGLCNLRNLEAPEVDQGAFRNFIQGLRRGDHIRLKGIPARSNSGERSLLLATLPEVIAPCLPDLPVEIADPETRIRLRHLDFLVNPRIPELLRSRNAVIQYIRNFLISKDYLEVQTPILASVAGGAIARPFETLATEFPGRQLSLRIAPELWLKRLVIGGFDRVFEIGPSFRNEGVDLTHNPEFTTCEFYAAYANLEDLINMTESMLVGLKDHLQKQYTTMPDHISPTTVDWAAPFKRIDFIPHIEKAIGSPLPSLEQPDSAEMLRTFLTERNIDLPDSETLPQMLDHLSSKFIELDCIEPTFIVHQPECLSPLAKSFRHPDNGQMVAARAELFVECKEVINTYEEENSPIEQRRKFQAQLQPGTDTRQPKLDESYLEALEWGLPPTGGWGCGIERLCMLLTGTKRIGDVLSFGTIRNVAALGGNEQSRH